jgi:AcrR family transcriptional regulator
MSELSAESTPATPHREPLTRDRIVDAALAIIDADGLAALSMRKLGASLGVEAMAIYHHFPNKEAVLEGVTSRLLAVGADYPKGMEWRAGLKWGADALRAAVAAHPKAAPLLIVRPLTTPEGMAWIEGPLALLKDAGFSDRDTVDLFHAVLAYLFGWVTFSQRPLAAEGTALSDADLHRLAPTANALRLLMADWDRGFGEGMDALLDSWEHRLPPGSRGAVSAAKTVKKAGPAKTVKPGGSRWIVQVGGDGHAGKKKTGKKKDKAKKHKA